MADEFDLDFEDDDLGLDDDLDFDMDPLAVRPPAANSREAATNLLKDASAGFTDDIGDDPLETASEIARAAIPDGLSKETDIVFELKDKLKDEVTDATKEVKSQAKGTVRALEKLLPKNEKITNVANKIMSFIGDEDVASRGPSAEETQNANIASYISDVMGEKTDRETMEDVIKHQIEANRHKTTTELTATVASNVENIRKFNNEITNSYFRRSLELQYKSLFTAKEQLAVIKTGMDTFKNQFEGILHNTALPDIVKTRNAEELKANIRGRLHDSLSGKYFSDDNVVGRVRKNLTDKVTGIKDQVLGGMGGIRSAADQKDMMDDMGTMGATKGGIAGSLTASIAKSKFGEFIGNKVSSNTQAQEGIHTAKNAFMDPTAFFKGKQEAEYNEDGTEKLRSKLKNGMFSFMEDMTGGPTKTNEISIGKTDLNGVASFDGRAHSSITKIIPGLLSKIYGEVKTIRTGGTNPEDNEISYSHNDDTFKTAKEMMADVTGGIKSDVSKDSVYYIDKVIDLLAKEGGLKVGKGKDLQELRKGFMSYIMDGGTLAPANMIDSGLLDHFGNGVTDDLESSINATLTKSKKEMGILDDFNYNLKNIKDSIPNMAGKVDELNNSGNLNILEDMGLVTRDKITKEASFSNEKYKKFVLEELEKTSTGDIQHLLDAKAEEVDKLKEEEAKAKTTYKDKLNSLKDIRDKTVTRFKESSVGKIGGTKSNIGKAKTYGVGAVTKLKVLSKEAENALRNQYFNSMEYKNGTVTSFEEYVNALGYQQQKDSMKQTIKDTLAKARTLDKKLFNGAKGLLKGALGFGGKAKKKFKTLTEDQEAALRTKFFASVEYQNGTVKTFEEYINTFGFTVDKKAMKGFVKTTLGKIPGMDKLKLPDMKLPGRGLFNKGLAGSTEKVNEVKDTVTTKVDSILDFLKKDKADKKEPKKSIFDSDGDGDRDGNWKERLLGKKKKDDKKPSLLGKAVGKSKDLLGGLGSMLMMAVPMILGTLGKIPKLLGSGFKVIKSIATGVLKLPGLLMKLPMLLGGVIGKMMGGITSLIKGGTKVATKVAMKASATGATALAAAATKAKLTPKTVKPKIPTDIPGKKPKPGMIKSMLNKFTDPIMKKFGKKAGLKVTGKLAAKVAARAIPFAGAALLAYDSVMIAKDMFTNKTSFKSAVSKQILGFDLFSDDSVAKDEDGNPIKPDDQKKDNQDDYIASQEKADDEYWSTKKQSPAKRDKPANNLGFDPHKKGTTTTASLVGKSTLNQYTNKVEGDGVSEDSTRTKKESTSGGAVGNIYSRGGPYADPAGGFTNMYKNGKDVDYSGFHPTFAKHLAAMANEYYELTGEKIPINSAYRSYEKQVALKRKYGNKAATPGNSPHGFGLAFDTNTSVAEKLDKLGLMKKYGFTRPVGKETWHVEAIGNSLDMGAAKKDPAIAEQGLIASLGKGGAGWGAGSKGSNKNRGRNTKHQAGIMDASGKEVKGDEKESPISTLQPANNVGIGRSKMGSSPTMRSALMDSETVTPTEDLPNAGVDTGPKPIAQVTAPGAKPKAKKITSIDDATNNLNKVKNDQLVKPMQNNMDLSRQANTLLAGMSNSLEQSLDVQRKMLDTLSRIEKASGNIIDIDVAKQQALSTNTNTSNDTSRNRSTLPEPVVGLKRKTDISA